MTGLQNGYGDITSYKLSDSDRSIAIADRHAYVAVKSKDDMLWYVWIVLAVYIPEDYDWSDPYATVDTRKLERVWIEHWEPRDMWRLQMLGAGVL